MAEYVMKDLVQKRGLENEFVITSGAVTEEELGNPIYPPAQKKLREKDVAFGFHRAHKITPAEFQSQDLVVVMDRSNLRLLTRIVGDYSEVAVGDPLKNTGIKGKVHMMMEFAGTSPARDVADPWYTGNFEQTYQDVVEGCNGLLDILFPES